VIDLRLDRTEFFQPLRETLTDAKLRRNNYLGAQFKFSLYRSRLISCFERVAAADHLAMVATDPAAHLNMPFRSLDRFCRAFLIFPSAISESSARRRRPFPSTNNVTRLLPLVDTADN